MKLLSMICNNVVNEMQQCCQWDATISSMRCNYVVNDMQWSCQWDATILSSTTWSNISHVHWAYDYLGPFGVLWVHMAWHKNFVKKNIMSTHTQWLSPSKMPSPKTTTAFTIVSESTNTFISSDVIVIN